MYISAIKYLLASLATAVFGVVYEHFSHGVTSLFMVCAFLIPLLGGTAALLLHRHTPDSTGKTLYNLGLLTLTVGSLMQGILEIYGTTNHLCRTYWIAGLALILLGCLRQLRKA